MARQRRAIPSRSSPPLAQWGMFVAGLFTVAHLSFCGNYLPRLDPSHLRGTGEGFAANLGSRPRFTRSLQGVV